MEYINIFKIKQNSESVNDEQCKQSYFEKLVKEYSTEIYRFAFWLSKDHSVSDDLVQETFLRAWKALDKLIDEKKTKAWLFTILRRENLRRFQRKRFDFVDIDKVILEDHVNLDPQLHLEYMQIHEAILNLGIKYREPLLLQVIGGFNSLEISQILKINISTVNVRLYRARNQLRSLRRIDHFILEYTY
ncbi:MAG: sigma-70 family RNA polymerase sigma factor [Gammaproteobacteria bacterium]|nr:sigma-70 family RNA polymerase sigma factor [Gammaproteobacteria bacterium]